MARVALSEPFMIAVERQEIYLRKLPKALDGFRIVHLSDLHYGPMVEARHLHSTGRGECLTQAGVESVAGVTQRLDAIRSSLQLTNRLTNAALLQAAHKLVGADDV
jgi:hypothetical protein